jgi:hypothetical protein
MSSSVTIETITHEPKRDAFVLICVEQGPWLPEAVPAHFRRIQDRLLDCVDAAVDGGVARLHPDSIGKLIVIRLNCYDTPQADLEEHFFRVAEYVHQSEEIQAAIRDKLYVAGLEFEFNCRTLRNDA